MQHIKMMEHKFDISKLKAELDNHPHVWNAITLRTDFDTSPHREVDDVWCRYNALSNWNGDGAKFNSEHQSVWYPVVEVLPGARLLAIELKQLTNSERLGGVLITRIPAGKQVYPHVDPGWHARYYDKFVIQIASDPSQGFCYEDGKFQSAAGDCYWFDNSVSHWVVNPSQMERISLIVCLRNPTCH